MTNQNPSTNSTQTELRHCYVCDTLATLSKRSRCADCEYDLALANQAENDLLRERIAQAADLVSNHDDTPDRAALLSLLQP